MASQIIKGVVEEWAPRRLTTPMVVAISEPGAKLWVMDAPRSPWPESRSTSPRCCPTPSCATSEPTPDVLDRGSRGHRWRNQRHQEDPTSSLGGPTNTSIPATADSSPHSARATPARRRLKDIAVDTYCWFLDGPSRELAWNEIPPSSSGQPTTPDGTTGIQVTCRVGVAADEGRFDIPVLLPD